MCGVSIRRVCACLSRHFESNRRVQRIDPAPIVLLWSWIPSRLRMEEMEVVTTEMSSVTMAPVSSSEESGQRNELALTLGLREEMEEQRYVDTVLHCRHDALVYTHRIVLAGLSPVLKAALKADEKNEVDMHTHVFMPDVEADEIKDVLTNIYVGGFEPVAIPQSLLYLGLGWPVFFEDPNKNKISFNLNNGQEDDSQNVIKNDEEDEEENEDEDDDDDYEPSPRKVRLRSKPATVAEREAKLLAERRFYSAKKRGDGRVRQVRTRAGSHVWKFFALEKETRVATCNVCFKTFNTGNVSTSNLSRHLRSHHPEAYDKLERLNYGEDIADIGLDEFVQDPHKIAKKEPLDSIDETIEEGRTEEEHEDDINGANDHEATSMDHASETVQERTIEEELKLPTKTEHLNEVSEDVDDAVGSSNEMSNYRNKDANDTSRNEGTPIGPEEMGNVARENGSDDPLKTVVDDLNLSSSQDRRDPRRSIVWSYFDCPEKDTAACNLCDKSFNMNNSSTTNLLRHLKSKHPELKDTLEQDNKEKKEQKLLKSRNNDNMASQLEESRAAASAYVTIEEVNYNKVSPIWVHFQQLDVDKVQCQHCDQVFKMAKGSTSTALRHLRKKHPEKENEVKEQVFSEANTLSDFMHIWKYFDEDKGSKTAVCKTCRMPIYLGRQVNSNINSNDDEIGSLRFLADHLKHTHAEEYTNFEEEKDANKMVRGRVRVLSTRNFRPRAPIWSYFDYIEEKNGADCKACLQTVNMLNRKATSNLYKHLKRSHVKLYEQLLRESGRNEDEIQDMIDSEPKKRGPKPGPKPKDKETEMSRTCSKCGKVFAKYKGLLAHMRCVHSDRKPYSCEICGLAFAWRDSWKRHMVSHTNIKPYLCSLCGKTFMKRSVRDNHERIHMGERKFVCQTCGKHFTTKQRMDLHQRIHTGEKPFMCEYDGCGKRFHEKHHLVTHRRVHTGEKPYTCDICHQSFKYISAKTKHNCPALDDRSDQRTANIFSGQRFQIYSDEAHNATIAIMAD